MDGMTIPSSDAILGRPPAEVTIPENGVANLSRRGLFGIGAGALLLGTLAGARPAR